VIPRARCEQAFRAAVAACDPAERVRDALPHPFEVGIALGKASMAMARGAGPVARGIVVTGVDDGRGVPRGWRVMLGAHPVPDERSLAAGAAVVELITSTSTTERVLALVSGGASAMCEQLASGVTLARLHDEVRELASRGADIHAINAARARLSAIKAGKLARMCKSRIVTLAISDVFDDDVAVIGSGPTIAARTGDQQKVIAPMSLFAQSMRAQFADPPPLRAIGAAEIAELARDLPSVSHVIAWGEPSVALPTDHGEGGRAQQLALAIARQLRARAEHGEAQSAFVVGSDGIDGPLPRGRSAPAGAYVDGTTWDAIVAAGIDPDRALARCDAGTALHAVGALVVTGSTGINHADVAVIG
jgi:hydroxypyruvate reductase